MNTKKNEQNNIFDELNEVVFDKEDDEIDRYLFVIVVMMILVVMIAIFFDDGDDDDK